ncbi:MAG: radical SAM protein [Methanobacteriota archaeon]|nr:MAG: radical SAM protein [Euryarchaeota archaeon]HIB59550.1 radical SAM protein [Candidatus Poseidoniales archaeon]
MADVEPIWLLIDGYEDEPAAFGVPPYVGFHIRYIAGVMESHRLPYEYITIDRWREMVRTTDAIADLNLGRVRGVALLAGAVVPGKYLRGTPISLRETKELLGMMPANIPFLAGGWAIRGWRQAGWSPLRANLFLTVQDTDATLDHFLRHGQWKHQRRTTEQWREWAHLGATSKAVIEHPDIDGPLTYEVELYQGCVRYKNGCKFCIEPKKGVPIDRPVRDVLAEVSAALDSGVRHVRLGGMTDVYTYMAEGVTELEYPIPNPEPISEILFGLRQDERLETLHVDNGNPSIIAENLSEATEITKAMVETLSDGAILSFGLESADPTVHAENWLNCDSAQLKTAIRHINDYGRERGSRGLPKLLPGLNFIAGLNGETIATYSLNRKLLRELRDEGLWLRRINIRQVEGEGFQEIPRDEFKRFKTWVRDEIDEPLLSELFPLGQRLSKVGWESHDSRIRLPAHLRDEHLSEDIRGRAGVTFGRQIGAYPILIGVPYHIPLETTSDIIVTGHGRRSISGVEAGLDINSCSQKQLEAINGIGEKSAWKIISARARGKNKSQTEPVWRHYEEAFAATGIALPENAEVIFGVSA